MANDDSGARMAAYDDTAPMPAVSAGRRIRSDLAMKSPDTSDTRNGRDASPMTRAFGHYETAETRLIELLAVLDKELSTLTSRLEPILHDGSPVHFPESGETADDTVDVDTRSQLVRVIDQQADRLEQHGGTVRRLTDKVRGITQAVEL